MITGIAHTAICVPDLDVAVAWYTDVLGLAVLSPPVLMDGPEIRRDMGELVPDVALRAAILGVPDSGDRVLELIEYPQHPGAAATRRLTDHGCSHVGLTCDDLAATRARLEAAGVEFLTSGTACIVGLATTWFRDPWGVIFILMEKTTARLPYFRQWEA